MSLFLGTTNKSHPTHVIEERSDDGTIAVIAIAIACVVVVLIGTVSFLYFLNNYNNL